MTGSSIVFSSSTSLDRAVDCLLRGELVGIPTETVYGLAAKATDPVAVAKIFAAKQRPSNNPLILHVADREAAERWVQVRQPNWLWKQWCIATRFWPGPLTLVVPRGGEVPDIVTAGRHTVAIRVPNHPVTLDLLRRCDFPLAAPSANPSNYVSPTRAQHVADGLGDQVSLVIDGGPCQSGVESTIIQLAEDGPRLLRPGGISTETLSDVFPTGLQSSSREVLDATGKPESVRLPDAAMIAPGQFAKHYSPVKRLYISAAPAEISNRGRVGRIAFRPLQPQLAQAFAQVWILSQTGDLEEVARNLFAALREADASDCDYIVIDRCPEQGIGKAIMDRINRAASHV